MNGRRPATRQCENICLQSTQAKSPRLASANAKIFSQSLPTLPADRARQQTHPTTCATKGLAMKRETNSGNSLAVTGQTDLFRTYADACAPRTIVGKLLKFSKGDFIVGDAGETIADDVEFTALMDELVVGWVRWEDNKI